jgi:rare lipoprotein A
MNFKSILFSFGILLAFSSNIYSNEWNVPKQKKKKQKKTEQKKVDTLQSKETVLKTVDTTLVEKHTYKFYKKNVHASYYAQRFEGSRTASGARFNNTKYTAAHKKLPFGTKVRVTNEANGKSVIVEITDRGPFSKVREIDLSKKAFMDIVDNKFSGSVTVKIEVQEN